MTPRELELKQIKRERAKDLTLKLPIYMFIWFAGLEIIHYGRNMIQFGWEARDVYDSGKYAYSTGHSAVYFGIWVYVFIVFYFCNSEMKKEYFQGKFSIWQTLFSSIHSFIYDKKKIKNLILPIGLTMMMVGLCEGMFNLSYYLTLLPNDQIRFAVAYSGIVAYGTLALLLMSAFVPMWFKLWRALNFKWFLISLLTFFTYLAAWTVLPYFLGYGFLPITINATIGETVWYPNYWVNAVEILSWWAYMIPAFMAFFKGSKNYEYSHSKLYYLIHRNETRLQPV